MAVAIYAPRVSTEEQRERQSIETQLDYARRYCDLNGLPVFRVFADNGISGTVPWEKRPEAEKSPSARQIGQVRSVAGVQVGPSRPRHAADLEGRWRLRELGVRVRSMTEEFVPHPAPPARTMLTMLSGFATHERECIRERSVQVQTELPSWAPGWAAWSHSAIASSVKRARADWRSRRTRFPAMICPRPRSSA